MMGVFKNMRLFQYRFYLFILFGFIFVGAGQTQQNNHQVMIYYEQTVQQAARNWLRHNYTGALDGFYSARELLLYHMPLPSDVYSWNTFFSLKIYTVLLTRLVEIELHQKENQIKLEEEVSKQARDWAIVLEEQMKIWKELKSPSVEDEKMRQKWMKRFRAVIQKVYRKS